MKKYVIIMFAFFFVFSIKCSARQPEDNEIYKEQYELSEADQIKESLPDETADYLAENGIDPENPDWVNSLTSENVFSHIWEFLKSGAKSPLAAGAAIFSVIIISAALSGMETGSSAATTALYATVLSVAAVICVPVISVITASVNAMQGCAVFMTAFVPVFAVIVASSGAAVTSVSMSALLLGAAQTVSYISNFVVIPLLSGFLAISIATSVSPLLTRSGIADGIKKIAFWIMSLMTTVFVGILSIQTAVNASADTLAMKTAKFIVGSSVPVAGTVLSEALTTVTASMGILKSSVGVYGVIACCAIFLPLLAELFIWRIVLMLNAVVSDLFSLGKISGLLRSVDTVISVIIGIIMLTCAMFVISLSIVVSAGKT